MRIYHIQNGFIVKWKLSPHQKAEILTAGLIAIVLFVTAIR